MALVRARHNETGHIAALPKDALALGMCPGWAAADGPAPAKPKTAAFPPKAVEETEDAGEQTPPETADTSSAKTKRS